MQENFHFYSIYVAVVCTTTVRTEHIRLCVSRYDQSAQNCRQKVFTGGALTFVQGGLILKIY